jgi:hypothetical protein
VSAPDDPRGELRDVLAPPAPTTIPEVIERLTEIERITCDWPPRTEHDGIACFTRLYLRITRDVQDADAHGRLFAAGEFIRQLDVAFARRYLAALEAWVTGSAPTPSCWAVLFDRRAEDVTPWRFAAAGVNAHVNFDLAFALLDVWEANPIPLAATEAERADYDAINDIFYRRMEELCETFDAPWSLPHGTTVWERAGTILGDVLVWGTRDLAWTFAERMWANRRTPDYRVGPGETLDVLVTGFARTII